MSHLLSFSATQNILMFPTYNVYALFRYSVFEKSIMQAISYRTVWHQSISSTFPTCQVCMMFERYCPKSIFDDKEVIHIYIYREKLLSYTATECAITSL